MAGNCSYAGIQNVPPVRPLPNFQPTANVVSFSLKLLAGIRLDVPFVRVGSSEANHSKRKSGPSLVSGGRGRKRKVGGRSSVTTPLYITLSGGSADHEHGGSRG